MAESSSSKPNSDPILTAEGPKSQLLPHQQHALFDKIAILCGPINSLLFFLILPMSLNLPPVSPSATPEETAYHYVYNEKGLKGGIPIMLMTGITWPIFCAGINRQLAKIPGVSRTALWAQLGAGCLATVSLMLPAIFFSAVIYRLDRDPVLTQLLSDLAWLVYMMSFPPFVAQDLMISYAILSDRRPRPLIPRWAAWATSGLAVTLYPAIAVHCVKSGAFAWNGALAFWVGMAGGSVQLSILVFFLWKAHAKPDPEE